MTASNIATPVGIQSLGDAPRRTKPHPVDQRLQLDEQRAAALARDGDDAAGGGLGGAREENGGRVAHLLAARSRPWRRSRAR